MKVSKEGKEFIRSLLNETRPMFMECMDHLRENSPAEYDRLHTEAAQVRAITDALGTP